ncbi:MAG TPA: MBL fold metallo-hydrolase [Holosporales bacterium]|nr:MBL fold metallo-hydrolase [Holosporales bacterium]
MTQPKLKEFFHKDTSTMTYIVWCEATKKCAIIDSVLDYDPHAGRTSTHLADDIIAFINEHNLSAQWILETHIHADHLTAASHLKKRLNAKTAIGERIKEVLDFWVPLYNIQKDTPSNGVQFDHLFQNGETFKIGNLNASVIHTPGHTPACVSYHIEDSLFVGDSIFMPNLGTARVDFPGGSAETLYQSIQALFTLPDGTKIFVGHIYPKPDEPVVFETSIKEQKQKNIMLNSTTSLEDYRAKREARDKTLGVPRLLLPSLQVNLRAGNPGDPESNGTHYIKIPLNKI